MPLKKYFYVLRPLLAVRWLERYGTAAPIEFERLLHLIEDKPSLLADVRSLLDMKKSAPEMGMAHPIDSINNFVTGELERLEMIAPDRDMKSDDVGRLTELFQRTLKE